MKGLFDLLTSKGAKDILKKKDIRNRRKEMERNHGATIDELTVEKENLELKDQTLLEQMVMCKPKGTAGIVEDVRLYRELGMLEAKIAGAKDAIRRVEGLREPLFVKAPDEYVALFDEEETPTKK